MGRGAPTSPLLQYMLLGEMTQGARATPSISDINRTISHVNAALQRQADVINRLAQKVAMIENRMQLEATKEILREQYRQAYGYSNIVVGAGYVGAFAIWAFVKDLVDPRAHAAAAVLIGFSLTVFVFWEVFQAASAAIAGRQLELDLQRDGQQMTAEHLSSIAARDQSRRQIAWPIVLAGTLVPGVMGIVFLLWPLVGKAFGVLFG